MPACFFLTTRRRSAVGTGRNFIPFSFPVFGYHESSFGDEVGTVILSTHWVTCRLPTGIFRSEDEERGDLELWQMEENVVNHPTVPAATIMHMGIGN